MELKYPTLPYLSTSDAWEMIFADDEYIFESVSQTFWSYIENRQAQMYARYFPNVKE